MPLLQKFACMTKQNWFSTKVLSTSVWTILKAVYIQSFKQVRFKFYLFPIQSLFSKMGYPIFLSKNRQYEHLLINAKELDGLKKNY